MSFKFNALTGGFNTFTQADLTSIGGSNDLSFNDNAKVKLGNGEDLQIYHDPQYGHSFIKESGSGALIVGASAFEVYNAGISEKIISANADGDVELYFDNSKKFETTSSSVRIIGNLQLDGDNRTLTLGAGEDLKLYHDGFNSYIKDAGTGGIYLDSTFFHVRQGSAESMINAVADAQVELYFNGSKKFETTSTGVTVNGKTQLNNDLTGGDNVVLRLGSATNGDLQLYHDGTNSVIENATGGLYIKNDGVIEFQKASSGETKAKFISDADVELYYDNSKKFETLSTGTRTRGDIQLPFVDANNGIRNKISWTSQADYFDEVAYIAANRTALSGAVSDLVFATGSVNAVSERMRIHSNQFTSFGTTDTIIYDHSSSSAANDNGVVLDGNGSIQITRHNDQCLLLNRQGTDGTVESFYNDGTYVGGIGFSGGTTVYATSSDYRLKENVVTLSDAITRLKTLKPYRFNFIGKSLTMDGFFAHEVTAVPEAIVGEKDAEQMQGLDYSKLTPLLTAALQEAITKIETLETKVAALEAA